MVSPRSRAAQLCRSPPYESLGMFHLRAQRSAVVVLLAVAVYIGAYIALSRIGYAAADRSGVEGFYYCMPYGSPACRYAHLGCRVLFWPLNTVDCYLGFGRAPASLPLEGLQ